MMYFFPLDYGQTALRKRGLLVFNPAPIVLIDVKKTTKLLTNLSECCIFVVQLGKSHLCKV